MHDLVRDGHRRHRAQRRQLHVAHHRGKDGRRAQVSRDGGEVVPAGAAGDGWEAAGPGAAASAGGRAASMLSQLLAFRLRD